MLYYQAEHERILQNRENPNSSITWEEYKSMTFTLQVCDMSQPASFIFDKEMLALFHKLSM